MPLYTTNGEILGHIFGYAGFILALSVPLIMICLLLITKEK